MDVSTKRTSEPMPYPRLSSAAGGPADRLAKGARAGRVVSALAWVALGLAGLCAAWAHPAGAQDDGAAPPPAAAEQVKRVVIRFLTERDYPPFNYLDDEGVLTGFNVDLARAICLDLNAACDINVRPWDELILALKRGEADAVIAGHAITPANTAQVDFTDRYFHTPGRFAAKRDADMPDVSPEGFDGLRIGVAKGTAHEAFLKAFFRDSKIVTMQNQDVARDALVEGKVDAIFDDSISLAFWLNGTLSRQCCEFKGGPYLEPKYFGDGMAIAVPKTDPQIKALLNASLQRVRQSGRLEELVARYFPIRVY